MKHLLLGTTALAAAGLMVGQAYAADGVELSLGGRYYGAYGSHFDTQDSGEGGVEDAGLDRGDVVKQDIEVYFAGKTVLDNGLTVGARVELEGQVSADQIDAAYAYINGGFGELRIGDTSDALGNMCYISPSATAGMFGAESATFVFHNAGVNGYGGTNGTCYGVADKATKLMYFSPTFAGFQFGLSYAPDGTEDTRNTPGGFGTRNDGNTFQDSENISVAGTFAQDFNGVNVVVGGGVSWSLDPETSGGFLDDVDGRTDYQAYARVGFGLGDGTLTIGGAWGLRTNLRDNVVATAGGTVTAVDDDNDNEVWAAGVTYNLDAWTVGASASWGDYESACGAAGDSCGDTHAAYVVDGAYALGPGIDVGAMVGYDEYDTGDGVNAGNYEAFSAGMGIYIGF